jgi:hypothetical protein
MTGAQHRASCRSLFKQLEILPVPWQSIFSLMNFIINKQENVQTNSSIHNIKKMNHFLHSPNVNVSCFPKSIFYDGINIFKNLPPSLTILYNGKAKFKAALRKCLNTHSFHFADDFCVQKMIYITVL